MRPRLNELEELRRRCERLDQDLRKRPVRYPPGGSGSAPHLYTIKIIGGNVLSDTFTQGIVWKSPAPTTVPTLYDATVDTSFVDGIGRGVLYEDNTSLGNVLVAHYLDNGSPLTLSLFADQVVVSSSGTVTLPLVSDATQSVTLYVPQRP